MTFPPSTGVTPAQISELRKLTKADMADCRAALAEAAGDMDRAVLLVRERQVAKLQEQSGKDESECQTALLDTDGDMDRALNRLRSVNAEDYIRNRVRELLSSSAPADEVLDDLLALIWRRDMTDMSEVEKTLALVGLVRHHTGFGGFHTYFFTIGERNLNETAEALMHVRADRTARFLMEASRVAEGDRLDTTMEELDAELNQQPDNLAALAIEYLRHHEADFGHATP